MNAHSQPVATDESHAFKAMSGHADRWRGELLSYEAPTYFGMLCAAYEKK